MIVPGITKVYLDVCALCRPFDDQALVRIRMESDAVKLILQNIKRGSLQLVYSPVHIKEIGAFNVIAERIELLGIIKNLGELIQADQYATRQRAEYLVQHGFGIADAAHVAYAETVSANLITCDDKLLKKSQKTGVLVWSGDPLQFCSKENVK
jgi:predicted nucleic acid-binding protein